jgi:hypothetical protein
MTTDHTDDSVDGLARAAGLALTPEERAALAALHARFARDRALLAAVDLEETEPAVSFQVEAP